MLSEMFDSESLILTLPPNGAAHHPQLKRLKNTENED